MKTILFSALMFFGLQSASQDRWTVQLNDLQLLSVNTEDTAANVVRPKKLKKGSLIVTYVPDVRSLKLRTAEGERKRRLMVYDAGDNELYSKEAHSITIPVATLKKWRLTTPRVKIYTIPVLGEEGAAVRLRRIHLCTVNFE